MRLILGVIGTLFAPGFGQALAGYHRRAAFWVAWFAASVVAAALSIWAVPVAMVLRLAGIVDAAIVLRAARTRPSGDWIAAFVALGAGVAVALAGRAFVVEAYKMPSSSMYPTLRIDDHIFVDKLGMRLSGVQRGDVIAFDQPCEPGRTYVKRVIATAGQTVEVRCGAVYVDGKPLASRLVAEACTYQDQDEATQRWSSRDCSEYAETLGDRSYHLFHEPERPARDRKGGATSPRDFPILEGSRNPPSCFQHPGRPIAQAPGTLVETRTDAGPCESQLHYVVPEGHVFTLGDNRPNSNDSRYWGSVPLGNVIGRVRGIWLPGQHEWGRFGGVE